MIVIEFFTETDIQALLENRATDDQKRVVLGYMAAHPEELACLLEVGTRDNGTARCSLVKTENNGSSSAPARSRQ